MLSKAILMTYSNQIWFDPARSVYNYSEDSHKIGPVLLAGFIQHPSFVKQHGMQIKPNFFHDTQRSAAQLILDHISRYDEAPSTDLIRAKTGINIPDAPVGSEWLTDQASAFCRYKAVEGAILEGINQLQSGQFEALQESLSDAFKFSLDRTQPKFRWLSASDAINLPPQNWLVRGLIVQGTVSLLYGAPRSFKSFVLLDLVLRSASGMSWHERRTATRPVIYVASEGSAGLGFRMKTWSVMHRRALSDLPVMIVGEPVNLMDTLSVTDFITDAQRLGYEQPIVCVDTLAASMAGGDEDRARDMVIAINALYRIRDALDGTIVAVHHTGKDQSRGPRGSSSAVGNADCIIRCTREGDTNRGTLRLEKQKDGEDGATFHFRAEVIEQVDLVPGEGIRSGLVTVAGENANQLSPEEQLRWDTALIMNPNEVLGIKALCTRLGRGYGSSVVGTFTKAFPIDKEFRVETPSGDRLLRRIAVTDNGKIECRSAPALPTTEN